MIGDVIKDAREKIGISQRKLAFKMYLDPSTMCLIENGKQQLTSDKVVPICKLLHITPNELYEWDIEWNVE